jgi:hypothetical protein
MIKKKMKNNLLKYYITVFYLFATFILFAQTPPPPGNNDGSGGIRNDGDTTPAPIDDYLWVVALLGIVFVILKFRAIHKQINQFDNKIGS